MCKAFRLIVLLMVLSLVPVPESHAQSVTIKTIALSSDSNLSTGDPVIRVGGTAAIDASGKVMFYVNTERDGTRHSNLVTSNGTITSVLSGFDFINRTSSPSIPVLNSAGTVVFRWSPTRDQGGPTGVFFGSDLANLGFVDAAHRI